MNHRLRICIYTLLVVALALIASGEQVSLAEGTTIFVDADATGANNGSSWADAYTTLQPALDAAVSGDQIWVAEGIYTPTVANGGRSRRYRSFQLENGVALYGGFDPSVGVDGWEDRDWVSYSTILSGDLNGNDQTDFVNNQENSFHVFYHPAELALNSSAILDGFTIQGGRANGVSPHFYGGGILNIGCSPTISNVIFVDNWSYDGGGMYNWDSASPLLTNCTFLGNHAEWSGGGILNVNYSSPTIKDCTFVNNFAGTAGGGVNNTNDSSPIMINTIIWGNTSENGGGMHNYNSFPVLTNCTMANNTANVGGGIYNAGLAAPVVTNSIIWGNTPNQIANDPATVTYSDVEGGYFGVYNIALDPLFLDMSAGDVHLHPASPAIDRGNNAAPSLPVYDFEGDARILDGNGDGSAIVDMGVDEAIYVPHIPVVLFVKQDAAGANSGTSWVDAFTLLQSALARAMPGDQIWVAAGTYTPTREFTVGNPRSRTFQMMNDVAIYGGFGGFETSLDKRDWATYITILSGDLTGDDGPGFANNAENSYHVIYNAYGSDLNSSAILDGFTIRGGNANGIYYDDEGGGMFNSRSTPTISNCIFTGNSAYEGGGMSNDLFSSLVLTNVTFSGNSASSGGGMSNMMSNPVLLDSTFTNNTASLGGGMYNISSAPSLTNCTFTGNMGQNGGGMYNESYATPILTNCIFTGNSATNGGGMYNMGSQPTLTNSLFSSNSANNGGAIYNSGSYPRISNCTIQDNYASNNGGGMYNGSSASPLLTNCIFTGNTASLFGGGMYTISASPTLINCSFTGNAASSGGALYNMDAYHSPVLTNSIFWGDSPDEIYDSNSTPVVTYSDIQNGYIGTGNIDGDPLFVDAANRDFHLGIGSAAIDAGSNLVENLPNFDFEGDPRILDGNSDGIPTVDMGVDETMPLPHTPVIIFVDQNASGANNGTSWTDAFTELQSALAAAVNGDQVWVAAGIYLPSEQHGGSGERYKSFLMKNGVAIYGGFSGSESSLDERDWVTNLTILSGDIGILGDTSDNSYHVFYHPTGTILDHSAVLDGFIITGGNANGDPPHMTGGGMYNDGNSPALSNCIFINNQASYYAGGIYNNNSSMTLNNCAITDNTRSGIYNKNSSPVLTSCTISNNDGSGMYNNNSSPNLDHCIFTGNKYSGMHNYSSSPTLTNCTFAHNTYDYGGGMSNSYSSPMLSNCIFWANSATGGGGGMYNLLSTISLTNCTFSGNSAPIGGAMYNNSGWIALTNSIFLGDSSEIFSDLEYSAIVVTYSDVMGGHVGEGNLDLDPLFVDAANGDFHLSAGSPVIDMGSGAALVVDFEGDPRILDGNGDGVAIVDMGADEYNPESSARLGGALKLKAGQQADKDGLAQLSWPPVAILAVAGFYAVMPELVRKYSARNIPR